MSQNTHSLREQKVDVKPQTTATIYFGDTTPNHIQISNSASQPLYVGAHANVDNTTYDAVIPAYATRLVAGLKPYYQLSIFNSSDQHTSFVVKSWEGEFNPASVAQSIELVGGGPNGLLGIVEINNMLSPLPAGNNLIGRTIVQAISDPLPTGNNKVGRVDVDSLPNHAATYKRVVATASGIQAVTLKAGVVFKVAGNATLYDGPTQAWSEGDFNSDVGLLCNNAINLSFKEPGEAFILYKEVK